MALSDCIKCWDTPCTCGWDLRHQSIDELKRRKQQLEKAIDFKRQNPAAKFSSVLSVSETADDKRFMEAISLPVSQKEIDEKEFNEFNSVLDAILNKYKNVDRSSLRLLTGKELKIAAKKRLPVWCEEIYYDPGEEDRNNLSIRIMEPANIGYYIGDGDIVPDDYTDNDILAEDLCGMQRNIYRVDGVEYK